MAPLLSGANGAPRARVEKPRYGHSGQQRDGPDQHVQPAPCAQVKPERLQRRDAQQAVVLAQPLHVGHGVVERQAPCDGGQRQVVPRHAKRERTQQQRSGHRQGQPDPKREPRRNAHLGGQEGCRVGTHAHKGCLPKGGEPTHASQQHQAHGHQRVQANAVALRDPEIRHRQGWQHQHHQCKGGQSPAAHREQGGHGVSAPRHGGLAASATTRWARWPRRRSPL